MKSPSSFSRRKSKRRTSQREIVFGPKTPLPVDGFGPDTYWPPYCCGKTPCWSGWREIAADGQWKGDLLEMHDGPAFYELALEGPRQSFHDTFYAGETANESRDVIRHLRCNLFIEEGVRALLRMGGSLFYRAIATGTHREAVLMKRRLLTHGCYPWNVLE